ncbi:BON domain protein [Bremerella volcania]|uniref:BON domain protein n=1 Tax=Bremerella volcania TaxID=2527984 RepID=A0A518C3P4_9BACT|nr:BON domain-containing protein [Bremerella volcania]QDU73847.1 BON domain protein [Bremerella volcania]
MISSSMKDIRSRVVTALAACGNPRLRFIQVELDEEHENTVYLSGRVTSFYQKQLAQELVRSIDGDVQVRNNLRVDDSV